MSKGLSFRVSGDLGDGVFQLAIMSAIPGKHTIRCVDRDGVTAPFVPRVPLIKALFESQPYIAKVECSEKPPDVDLVGFRKFHSAVTTLIQANCDEYNSQTQQRLSVDGATPWLTAEPSKETKGMVVIARSPRYNNRYMPWSKIVSYYGWRLVFVGLQSEYEDFRREFGNVKYRPVKDFLELAQLIAGSDLFIGNQSSPHAVAMGLGHPIISEVCIEQPDCVFNRKNVQYVTDGSVVLDDFMGHTETIKGCLDAPIAFNRSISPPGSWQYPGVPPSAHYGQLIPMVVKLENCTKEEADNKIYAYNVDRCPDFFRCSTNDPLLLFKQAHQNAFAKAS